MLGADHGGYVKRMKAAVAALSDNRVPLDIKLCQLVKLYKGGEPFKMSKRAGTFVTLREVVAELETDYSTLASAALSGLVHHAELAMIRKLAEFPRLVETSAQHHEPHRVAFYLYDLASEFHSWWNRGQDDPGLRVILDGNPDLSRARLALSRAVQVVISAGLGILGVTPMNKMK